MLNIPISYEYFLENYSEQQPLLMPGACCNPLINWQDFDQMLQLMEPDEQSLQLFLKGQIPSTHYLDNTIEFGRQRKRINKYRFYEHLEHGATLVINRAEDFSLVVKQLCHAIGKFVQQPASSNIYINFHNENKTNTAQNDETTFGKHWDTHDVFAIQLIGKKRWRLFPPTLPLPLSHQTSTQLQHEPPETPSADYALNQGDILYIPRGWWHEVTPMGVDTLHLSVGTYAPTLTDYLMWAMSKTLPRISEARRGFSGHGNIVSTLEEVLQSVIPELLSQKNLTGFTQQAHAHERLTGAFQTALTLGKSDAKKFAACHFSLTSIYPPNNLNQDIQVNGGRLRLSPVSRAVIETLVRLQHLTWQQLCTQLSSYPATAIEISVLDLARHDVITIHHNDAQPPLHIP